MTVTRDKVRGAFVGLAIGDALGHATEFMSRSEILARFGPDGIGDFVATRHPAGTYTDDTQMSIAVACGLLDAGVDAPLDDLMNAVASRFVEWSVSPQNNRAPGATCLQGCRNLANGTPWRTAGVPNSKGCGSAMRVAAIGIAYEGERLEVVARASSVLTHGHPAALEGAVSSALAVSLALRGHSPDAVLTEVRRACSGRSPDFDACVGRLIEHADSPPALALSRAGIGEAWVAEEAFASAFYCWARTPDDFEAVVRCGANTDGDSDSIAAIAGSFAGAYLGLEAIPSKWVARVEDIGLLVQLADALYDSVYAVQQHQGAGMVVDANPHSY